jgi:hypothetical protein
MTGSDQNTPAGTLPWREFLFADRKAIVLAQALIALDLLFVVIHGVKFAFKQDFIDLFGYWIYRNLTITNDWAIPEITNYLKFLVVVILLVRVFSAIKQPIYLAWAFVYAVALVDDSMQVHENLGEYISTMIGGITLWGIELGTDEGLRVQDIGELSVYALYGGIFAAVLGVGFLRSDPIHRKVGLGFGLLLTSLAFFVGVVDMVDRMVMSHSRTLAQILATIEDGGEMVVVSLTVAFALIVFRRYGRNGSKPTPKPVSML